jgi:hypothetical protein
LNAVGYAVAKKTALSRPSQFAIDSTVPLRLRRIVLRSFGRIREPSRPRNATINLGNDDPDLVGASSGMGTEDRGRALAYENRLRFYRVHVEPQPPLSKPLFYNGENRSCSERNAYQRNLRTLSSLISGGGDKYRRKDCFGAAEPDRAYCLALAPGEDANLSLASNHQERNFPGPQVHMDQSSLGPTLRGSAAGT